MPALSFYTCLDCAHASEFDTIPDRIFEVCYFSSSSPSNFRVVMSTSSFRSILKSMKCVFDQLTLIPLSFSAFVHALSCLSHVYHTAQCHLQTLQPDTDASFFIFSVKTSINMRNRYGLNSFLGVTQPSRKSCYFHQPHCVPLYLLLGTCLYQLSYFSGTSLSLISISPPLVFDHNMFSPSL